MPAVDRGGDLTALALRIIISKHRTGYKDYNSTAWSHTGAGLTCGGRAALQCCWQSARQPPNRKWLWYPPWRRGWWTSWWALASWRTWRRCLCRSWLCHKLRPRLVRETNRGTQEVSLDTESQTQLMQEWDRSLSNICFCSCWKYSIAPHTSALLETRGKYESISKKSRLWFKLKLDKVKYLQSCKLFLQLDGALAAIKHTGSHDSAPHPQRQHLWNIWWCRHIRGSVSWYISSVITMWKHRQTLLPPGRGEKSMQWWEVSQLTN